MDTQQHHQATQSIADKTALWTLLVGLFLMPFFFIPSAIVPLQSSKALLFFVIVIVAAIAWIIARLKDGVIVTPRHTIYLFFIAIPFWFLLAALFSGAAGLSFVGEGYEIGTFAFITGLFVLMYIVSTLFTNTRVSAYAYLAFFSSFFLVALYQFIHLITNGGFSFGVFTTSASSIVGSWNDLGTYFGAAALFAFITLELLTLERKFKWLFVIIMIVSLFALSVIEFSMVWYVLAASAIIFFIYNFSFKAVSSKNAAAESGSSSKRSNRNLPWASLVIFIIAIIFILIKGNIYSTLSNAPFDMTFLNRLNVSNTEVRPSLSSTFSVALASMRSHPIFGIGPNRFSNEWVLVKPAAVNATPFWNTQFNYSIGLIPTFLVTTGPIGFLLWIGFFAYFLWLGFRSLFTKKSNPFAEYLTVSSFIIALYFWIFAIAYVPSATLLLLTFFFTGLFLASVADTGLIKRWTFDFSSDPKISFVSVLVFVALLLLGLVAVYGITRRFVAVIYYNQALVDANNIGNTAAAQNNLVRAIEFHADDVSYRALAQLDLVSIKNLLSQTSQPQAAAQAQFQQLLSQAEAAASAAQSINPSDYQNSLTLGQVAESVVPLNVAGASTTAQTDYDRAQKLDPTDPSIYLQMAELAVDENNPTQAEQYIADALNLKNDYTDAIFLLAQIQVGQGDTASAIKSLQAATLISPNDAGLQFNLGLLYYDTKDWTDATNAFEQAINIVPYYANAQYFLGLSLANQGDTADALKDFQNLLISNPGNSNITAIIANLQAGRAPLVGLQPPANTPQKAPNPPVKDTTANQTDGTAGR